MEVTNKNTLIKVTRKNLGNELFIGVLGMMCVIFILCVCVENVHLFVHLMNFIEGF